MVSVQHEHDCIYQEFYDKCQSDVMFTIVLVIADEHSMCFERLHDSINLRYIMPNNKHNTS